MRAGSSERGGRGKDARINVIGLLYVKNIRNEIRPLRQTKRCYLNRKGEHIAAKYDYKVCPWIFLYAQK